MSVQCKPMIGTETKAALSEFQHDVGLFREGYLYSTNPKVSVEIARRYMDLYPDFCFVDGWGTPLAIFNECNNNMTEELNSPINSHGGKREGSGRKKGIPTESVRLVADLSDDCKQLSDLYKVASTEQQEKIRDALNACLQELKP